MGAYVFLSMVFLHIVDDFYLQGILASMKQEKWWKENAPDSMYKNDYKMALTIHSFSWTFMIMLPLAYLMNFDITYGFIFAFSLNYIIHWITDDLKANWRIINLVTDQTIHFLQIFGTYIFLVFLG